MPKAIYAFYTKARYLRVVLYRKRKVSLGENFFLFLQFNCRWKRVEKLLQYQIMRNYHRAWFPFVTFDEPWAPRATHSHTSIRRTCNYNEKQRGARIAENFQYSKNIYFRKWHEKFSPNRVAKTNKRLISLEAGKQVKLKTEPCSAFIYVHIKRV